MNIALKIAILQKYRTQTKFSQAVGLGETMISKFVSGARVPSEDQKKSMAMALGMRIEDLFESTVKGSKAACR